MSANKNGLEIILNDFVKKIPYNVFLTNFFPKKSDLSKYSYSYIFSKTQPSQVYCVHGKGEYEEISINSNKFENLINVIENDEEINIQGSACHPIQFIEELKYKLYLMRTLPAMECIDNFKFSFIFIPDKTNSLKIYIIKNEYPYEIRDIDESKLMNFSIIDYNELQDFKFTNENVKIMQRIFLLQVKKIGIYLEEFEKLIQLTERNKDAPLPGICSFMYENEGINSMNDEYEQNLTEKSRDIIKKNECFLSEFLTFSVGFMFFEKLIKLRMDKKVDDRVFSNGGGEITIDDIVKCKDIVLEIYTSQIKKLISFVKNKKSALDWFELLENNKLEFSEKFKKIAICESIGYTGEISLSEIIKSDINFCEELPIMLSFSELSERWRRKGLSGIESRICKSYLESHIGCYLKADTDFIDSSTIPNTAESEDIIVKWSLETISDFSKKLKISENNATFPNRYSGYVKILPTCDGNSHNDINLRTLETKGSVKCNRTIYGSSSYKYNILEATDFEKKLGIKFYLKTSYKSKKRFDSEIKKEEDYYFNEQEIEQYEKFLLRDQSDNNVDNRTLDTDSTPKESVKKHCHDIAKKGGKRPKANLDIQNLTNVLYFIYKEENKNHSINNFQQWIEKHNEDTRETLTIHEKFYERKWVPKEKRSTPIKNKDVPDVILESLKNLKYDHIIISENSQGKKRIRCTELDRIEHHIDLKEYNSLGKTDQDEMIEDKISELETKDLLALASIKPYVKKAKDMITI